MRLQTKITCLLGAMLSLSILGCSSRNTSLAAAQNKSATLTGELPFDPLQGRVISSWIDRQDSTMSTLYGNEVAVQYARTHEQHNYPAGSILSVVTWRQQEDPRWFGARIPATVKSVEYVTVKVAPDQKTSWAYQSYEGTPLKKTVTQEDSTPTDRASWLLSMRAAVIP